MHYVQGNPTLYVQRQLLPKFQKNIMQGDYDGLYLSFHILKT